jgi:hypothetical protein
LWWWWGGGRVAGAGSVVCVWGGGGGLLRKVGGGLDVRVPWTAVRVGAGCIVMEREAMSSWVTWGFVGGDMEGWWTCSLDMARQNVYCSL